MVTTKHLRPRVDLLVTASVGWRLLAAGMRRKLLGPRRYDGTATQICEQIVRACFDGTQRFFRTSTSSYPDFWARDFGRCVPALLSLGFETEVGDTYRYALAHYERAGHFSLVITPRGELFDFPAYAPDGFAFFVFGLQCLGDARLVAQYRSLLEREARRFDTLAVDAATGLVRRRTLFSEAQDYAVRDCSCYSNVACYLLQRSLHQLGLCNPLQRHDYRELLLQHFWSGDHFLDDQSRAAYPSGDAQIMPFWSGVLGQDRAEHERLDTVLRWMDAQSLNNPLPSRYGTASHPQRRMLLLHRFNPWQRDTVWTCLGLHFLELLRDYRHPRFADDLERYRRLVARVGCFPEVLDADSGDLYSGPLIMSEDSMLWAANLWDMLRTP